MGNETTEMCAEKAAITAAFDYNRAEPCIVRETAHWAVVYKTPHLPTAPLRADERNTLVYWFLHRTEAGRRSREARVHGKKEIEAGLLHRLDTDTRGLVLFAKDQAVYDFLAARQEAGQMIKTYCAFVEQCRPDAAVNRMAVQEGIAAKLPLALESQFRNFGPGAKRVAPVFPGSRHYKKDGRLYTTVIEAVDMLPFSIGGNDTVPQTACESRPSPPVIRVYCRLSRGYRHQVRAHLAAAGLPIAGDPLYAPQRAETAHGMENTGMSLQLYAVKLEFPDPENPRRNICVALPPPDKMNP